MPFGAAIVPKWREGDVEINIAKRAELQTFFHASFTSFYETHTMQLFCWDVMCGETNIVLNDTRVCGSPCTTINSTDIIVNKILFSILQASFVV
jgi:hypothetical protein